MNLLEIFLIVAGLFSICGSIFNWEFFFNNRKARFYVNLMGRNGARIAYVVLGLFLLVFGVLIAAGVIENPQ